MYYWIFSFPVSLSQFNHQVGPDDYSPSTTIEGRGGGREVGDDLCVCECVCLECQDSVHVPMD